MTRVSSKSKSTTSGDIVLINSFHHVLSTYPRSLMISFLGVSVKPGTSVHSKQLNGSVVLEGNSKTRSGYLLLSSFALCIASIMEKGYRNVYFILQILSVFSKSTISRS